MIEAIKRGDEAAFRQAYENYRGKVYGYFLKHTRCPEDAGDLLQTTFLKLWKYRETLSPDYLLEQHLFHICRTVFIDHLRKLQRFPKAHALSGNIVLSSSQSHYSTEFDLRDRLRNALSAMPALRKKIFELNRLQGYSYQEIARELSISVKAVDNNLAKAVKFLRKTVILLLAFVVQP